MPSGPAPQPSGPRSTPGTSYPSAYPGFGARGALFGRAERSEPGHLESGASPGRFRQPLNPLSTLPPSPPARGLSPCRRTLTGPSRRFRRPSLPGAEARLCAPPGPSPNPPSRGGPPLTAGQVGGREGEKEGFRGRFSAALRASAAFFQLLELLRAHPSPPSSPHPAPSRWPGLTVIPLGAFTGNTSEGLYKNFARAGSRGRIPAE